MGVALRDGVHEVVFKLIAILHHGGIPPVRLIGTGAGEIRQGCRFLIPIQIYATIIAFSVEDVFGKGIDHSKEVMLVAYYRHRTEKQLQFTYIAGGSCQQLGLLQNLMMGNVITQIGADEQESRLFTVGQL